MDLPYNLLQLVVDGLAIALAARLSTGSRLLLALLSLALVSALLIWLLQSGAFHLFRLWAYAVFLHAPLVLLGIAGVRWARSKRTAVVCAAAAIGLLAVAGDAFLVEPSRLEVTRLRFTSDKLTAPLRIAVVADLQTDRIGSYERRALSRVMEAEPDLILMPGDYIHEPDPRRREELAGELRALLSEVGFRAPLGVFATRGNVEDNVWPRLFRDLPVRPVLVTTGYDVGEIRLTALGLFDSFDTTLEVPASDRFHVVVGHAPDFALGRVQADLLIAGHTHGGQVRLPFLGPPITFSRVPRAWAAGATGLPGGGALIVSRGIGMERGRAPRLRFLCRPELVIVDVEPGPQGRDR